MKFTKLSLVAALAVSAAFAGGDIEPVAAPVAEFPQTTIGGKATAYYSTDDSVVDMFDKESSALGTAITLDVSHKFNANIAANVTAVGFANVLDDGIFSFQTAGEYFEGEKSGAYFNVANITANYGGTTVVLGRQLLNTPMLSGFDWLLAPGAFEAYTAVNSSIENLTFVGSYVRTFRANNSGTDFATLDGDNWTVSAAFDNDALSGSVWYYNIDAGSYTQVYADAGYNFGVAKVMGQYVYTDIDNDEASNVFGVKATATLGAFNLMAAYVNVSDNTARWVGIMDGLYTSSWNSTTGSSMGNNFKVEAGTEFAGITASVSYAYYEYDDLTTDNEGSEIDVILGYNITDTIDINAVYTNTDWGYNTDAINALEIYANYKF
ncbi:MAG TPA: hypothetical protein EYG78_00750 [Sulfurovum sp.]|nr:hypothetical protein [Sulfurovum sp.]